MFNSFFKGFVTIIGAVLLWGNVWAAEVQPTALRLATEATYPPFEFVGPSGQIEGFDIDVVNALCQKMQKECHFATVPFVSLIPSLKLGKYDVVFGAMDITPERKKQVDFTTPYYVNSASFVVAVKNARFLVTREGLKGKKIGVQQGTTLGAYLQTHYGNAIIIRHYGSVQEALLDLQAGRVDAVLSDTPVVTDWIKKYGKGDYATLGEPISDPRYFGTGYAFAVRKGNTHLLNELNQALDAIQNDGTLPKLIQHYFGQ
jgi:arginine transport system substrate-binding protein